MTLWNFIRGAIYGRTRDYVQTKFNEMILIIGPRQSASMIAEPGSRTVVTGFAGTIWIQIEGRELGYTLKHGDSFEVPETGEFVFWAVNENVKARVHVVYFPPAKSLH